MTVLLAIVVGGLFAAAVYLMLRRSIVKLAIGLSILSNAANLVIFTAAGLTRGVPPLAAEGEALPPAGAADPLPQAMILTAIVISFGVLAFTLVLMHRVYQDVGSDDLDEHSGSEV
ncbi:MAG: Na+/H+ antiporter subunit C [Chloroflexi bacterium]|nr:Na+/H+ antiporter subunit C [Chloroflexota bacterium]